MKKMLYVAAALGAVIASPALAQSYDPDLGSGNIGNAPTTYSAPYQSAAGAYRGAAGAYLGAAGAYARVPYGVDPYSSAPRGAARVSPNAVYHNEGQVIGADPDPNVRQQLHRDHDAIE